MNSGRIAISGSVNGNCSLFTNKTATVSVIDSLKQPSFCGR